MILSLHTLFKNDLPYLTSIYNPATEKHIQIPLYQPNTGLCIADIEKNIEKINKFINKCLSDGGKIITSDFKSQIKRFDLNYSDPLQVYDIMLPSSYHVAKDDAEHNEKLADGVSKIIGSYELADWQKLIANAGVIYDKFERRGVNVAGLMKYSLWSQRVFSGRSSTSNFNIQGADEGLQITNPDIPGAVFVHFDWKAADIRIAALLSGDEKLLDISCHDDPYTTIADELGIDKRSDAKLSLLAAINSMSVDSRALKPFPGLTQWIRDCRRDLRDKESLDSILGRNFKVAKHDKKNDPKLAVFNATMQGSIAHAMQHCISRVWSEIGTWLFCEIHDSLVITCPNQQKCIRTVIDFTVDVMRQPFAGLLDDNPTFPLVVSVGTKWKKWKRYKVF